MTLTQWFAFGVLVQPFAVLAQQTSDPLDVNAAVPASAYESAFKNYRAAANEEEAEVSPDKTWRSANAEVGKLAGHAGHMKDQGLASPAPMDHGKHHESQGR